MPITPPALPPAPPAIEISRPDGEGRITVAFNPDPPIVLYAPIVSFPLADPRIEELGRREFSYEVEIPNGCITAVRSFIGWDIGSVGEATIEVVVAGFRLYERSDHKERGDSHYNAWEERSVHFSPRIAGRQLVTFAFSAQMLAPRTFDGGLSTRVQGAIRLVIEQGCEHH